MKRLERDSHASRLAFQYIESITKRIKKPLKLMEVCGTHTISIFRSGIRSLIPSGIQLISGPGCPVCVTPAGRIEQAMKIAALQDVILVTFGDLMRVPWKGTSLEKAKSEGCDIRIALSPMDALSMAKNNPSKKVVFLGVGFETTSPAIAVMIKEAEKTQCRNLYLLCAQKLVPPALKALVSGSVSVDGFILPGHVSVIIGSEPYRFLAEEYRIPGVITGFEPLDILEGLDMLTKMCVEEKPEIQIQYKRAVIPSGNKKALEIMDDVFEPVDAYWRNLGVIENSGLRLKDAFDAFDAERRFDILFTETGGYDNALCGEILQGLKAPPECPLFASECTPANPVGPSMVSSEGTCAAFYRYGGFRGER